MIPVHINAKGMESQMNFNSPNGGKAAHEFHRFADHVHQAGMCLFFFRYENGFRIGFGMQEIQQAG